MATATVVSQKVAGGSFLIEDRQPEDIFTPEDFTDQHQLIAQTSEDFAINEILPAADAIERKDSA